MPPEADGEASYELEARAEIAPAPPPPDDDDAQRSPTDGRRTPNLDPPFTEVSSSGALSFIADPYTGRYRRASDHTRLRNSLLFTVGLLELANAGDFAANVWNQVPPPTYAVVLMVLGGVLALVVAYCAAKDARLAWANVRGLRAERAFLLHERERIIRVGDRSALCALDSLLDVNFRESGTEIIDRVALDTLMGFGAVTIGIGTLMAIAGANRSIFIASNLLSGYVGNAPCAVYGVVNLAWSGYVWWRARRHTKAASRVLGTTSISNALRLRTFTLQLHAALNGTTGMVAGAAALATATQWYAYVALLPCIATAAVVTVLWRTKLGYDRPFVSNFVPFTEEGLLVELARVESCRRKAAADPARAGQLSRYVSRPSSLLAAVEFITKNQLFEEFCLKLLADQGPSTALFVPSAGGRVLLTNPESIAAMDGGALGDSLLQSAKTVVAEAAPTCFLYQERYLLETLGCYLCRRDWNEPEEALGMPKTKIKSPTSPRQRVYSDVGRHGDAWLFGWHTQPRR